LFADHKKRCFENTKVSCIVFLCCFIHQSQNNRWIRIQFRLLASIPPIVLGILERQLGTITDYAGTTGFVIGFSFPALLFLQSRQKALSKGFAGTTAYTSYASWPALAWSLFGFGICMVIYVVYFLIGDSSD